MSENVLEMEAYRKKASIQPPVTQPPLPLFGGGGGGISGGMDAVDAKIAASEARTDTKFEKLRGDLKDFSTKSTVWGASATVVGIILAVLAFGGDRFDAGVGSGSSLAPYVAAQKDRDDAQDGKLDEILSRLPQADNASAPSSTTPRP